MVVSVVRHTAPATAVPRPLLVSADGHLLDELVRIAASVDVLLDVAPDVSAARLRYDSAPLVLIGIDLAPACLRAGLRRSRDVALVGRYEGQGPPDWAVADGLGVEHIAALPAAEPWLARQLALASPPPGDESVPPLAVSGSPDREPAHPARQVAQPDPASQWALLRGSGASTPRPVGHGQQGLDRSPVEGHPQPPAPTAGRVGSVTAGVSRTRGLAVAVLGGRGGAGASVLATALAVTAARAQVDTMLVDADPLGGGLDLVLGWEELDGVRWPALATGAPAVDAVPRQACLAALSFDRSPAPRVSVEALASTLASARRRHELVVVDLPRRLDDGALLALADADQAYLIVPAELRACAAAIRVAEVARQHCDRLALVVRGPAPGGLTIRDVTAALALPLAGYLRSEPGLARALESGAAPARDGKGPLAALCRQLLAELGVAGQEAA